MISVVATYNSVNHIVFYCPVASRNVIPAKEGKDDDSHLLRPMPASHHREKRKSLAHTSKGYHSVSRLDSADNKPQTSAKDLVDDTNAASEAKESHQLITKVSRKRQKIVAPKVSLAITFYLCPSEFLVSCSA